MSTNSNDVAILNILIPQGSDFEESFQIRHSTTVRCPVLPSASVTGIKIEEMGITMMAGDTIQINCDDLVLSSDLSPNDRILYVEEVPNKIANGETVTAKPIDITGWTFSAKLSDALGTVSADFTCAVTDGLEGRFSLRLPKVISTDLKSNCTWEEYQGIDIQSIGQPLEVLEDQEYSKTTIKRIEALLLKAYRWDIESADLNASTLRRVEGFALVSEEVTK